MFIMCLQGAAFEGRSGRGAAARQAYAYLINQVKSNSISSVFTDAIMLEERLDDADRAQNLILA